MRCCWWSGLPAGAACKTANPCPDPLGPAGSAAEPGGAVSAASGFCGLGAPAASDLDLPLVWCQRHSRRSGVAAQLGACPTHASPAHLRAGAAGGDRARAGCAHPGERTTPPLCCKQACWRAPGDTTGSSLPGPHWLGLSGEHRFWSDNRAGYGRRSCWNPLQPCSMAPLPPPSRPPTWKHGGRCRPQRNPFRESTGWGAWPMGVEGKTYGNHSATPAPSLAPGARARRPGRWVNPAQ